MLGNLNDAPEWATHYVERERDVYWFVNFNNFRWTKFNNPKRERTGCSARALIEEDIPANPNAYTVIELNITLENE